MGGITGYQAPRTIEAIPDAKALRAARNRRYRQSHPGQGSQSQFIGIDGEGAGADQLGRQHYRLLCAGRRELYRDGAPLSTADCLEFLLSLPRKALLVGYFFTYDATQILRDLPAERIERLLQPVERAEGVSPYTYWRDYAIEFVPGQYFRVARRLNRNSMRVKPNSSRTVNEVGQFFQKSFVAALLDWGIGDKRTIAMIAENKERRGDFEEIGERERRYCVAECRLLAELMTKFRATCVDVGIVPRAWRGPGHIAARLHELHKTPRRRDRARPQTIERMAGAAYYGGRFEVTTIGRIEGAVYEYDLVSAYPAAMLRLPCPVHTVWRKFVSLPPSDTYMANVQFDHAADAVLCGLPIRKKGHLFWPRRGAGVYWSCEIAAARRAGAAVTVGEGYAAIRKCDCHPFDWIAELFDHRERLGKTTQGYPIKLGLNGLYGKLAQRLGAAPWRDYVLAGLTTALVRSWIIDACAERPDHILMIATDAVYSASPLLGLEIGRGLGQWEEIERDGIFIVQPGIYWSRGSVAVPKTRGIPRSAIIERRDQFERAWDSWIAGDGGDDPPAVNVPTSIFVGHRLAKSLSRLEIAGSWVRQDRRIDFDWHLKRRPAGRAGDGSAHTEPFLGGAALKSEPYDPELLTDLADQLLEQEALPDYEPWGNSGE